MVLTKKAALSALDQLLYYEMIEEDHKEEIKKVIDFFAAIDTDLFTDAHALPATQKPHGGWLTREEVLEITEGLLYLPTAPEDEKRKFKALLDFARSLDRAFFKP